ncbi:hypothetical protein UK12_07670 [Saccharothrix sp. ST-888]|nr:hypothetical protein [Saccharothrix sp. ST-888]KJK58834.1 hypothetical protein UK12_07670 [Saccharothrix sp. ST-888]
MVVVALADGVCLFEEDAEAGVDSFEVDLRLVDHVLPRGHGVGIAALEVDDAPAGAVGEGGVTVELGA